MMPRSTSARSTRKNHKQSAKASTPKARASWRGMVRFGLVSFPVEAFNAHAAGETPAVLHQLHAECHSRIRYQKTCPIHGPVANDEIVSGYEVRKGKYVEIAPEELDEIRTDGERALTIDAFVAPDEIDIIHFDGRMYFLSPDGDVAREPYAVFLSALKHQDRWGVGEVVFSGKQYVVVVRPYGEALHMAMLNFGSAIRDPADAVAAVATVASSDKKVRLAEQLIESWTDDDFKFSHYHDDYAEKLKELIDAKVEGRKLVMPEVDEEPAVINLMDALRKSIGKSATARTASVHGTPRNVKSQKQTKTKRRHAS